MSALARALAALLVVAVLADASACMTAPSQSEPGDGGVRISATCLCGCHAHTGSLAGIGLSQLAATPAETPLPLATHVGAVRAAVAPPRSAPVRGIDHVPIALG